MPGDQIEVVALWVGERGIAGRGKAAELAVTVHPGSLADVDRAYGTLAAYVASHELRLDGPIREYYLVGRQDTADEKEWRTEICWPIFSTGRPLNG